VCAVCRVLVLSNQSWLECKRYTELHRTLAMVGGLVIGCEDAACCM
jgi:hypothetical protein